MLKKLHHQLTHKFTKNLRSIPLSTCVLCNIQHNYSHTLLCKNCDDSLPVISHYCDQCGRIISSSKPYYCRYCLKKPSIFDDAFSFFHYQSPIDYCIKQLKFQQQLLYAELLGHKMAEALMARNKIHSKQATVKKTTVPIPLPDAIFPVPLHPKRIRHRGFNQSLEIARPIAKKLNIPLVTNELIRSRHTQAQTELTATQRRNNLKNSFLYQPTHPYKHIAIVDDVMTTGTTLYEVAKVLKQHSSVENISVWVCACADVNSNAHS